MGHHVLITVMAQRSFPNKFFGPPMRQHRYEKQ